MRFSPAATARLFRQTTQKLRVQLNVQARLLDASADVSARRQAESALAFQSLHDGLTGLANRTLLHVRLEQTLHVAHSTGLSTALLLLDLDRFKEVNDTLGHQMGDILLQQIGQRLETVVRSSDLVARLGGDEFGVLLADTDTARTMQVADVLARVLQTAFVLGGQPVAVDVSIGVALAPLHGPDAESLLRCADIAMYQAKRSGTGIALYSAADDQNSPDRLTLLGELRSAIDRDELVLYYQPKLDLRDGSLVGIEALVRWQHPQRGFLPPDTFIPLAEQTGLIYPLSHWVLEAALTQHQAWRRLGIDVPVAVNLSRRALHDPHLPGTVAHLLERWHVPPDALVLEITESSLMADPVRAGENLRQLRALGVRMSIDDFGTGYSSLASLKNLSVDELKIDQSFVRAMAVDASSRAIVRAIIDLADALKLRVVAEGVEDRATLDVLAGLGCDVAQGYFLSRPMPGGDLQAWVARAGPEWLAIAEQRPVNDALQERFRERGARLTAEEEFVARKQAEAALRESEERFRSQYRGLPIPTYSWLQVGHNFVLQDYNDAARALTGSDLRAGVGALASDRYASQPAIIADMHACIAEQRTVRREVHHRIPDSDRQQDLSISYVFVPPSTVMLHAEDITEPRLGDQHRASATQSEKLRALGQMTTGVAQALHQSLLLVSSTSELAQQALIQHPVDLDAVQGCLETTTQAAADAGESLKRLVLFTKR